MIDNFKKKIEEKKKKYGSIVSGDKWRNSYHIMPEIGWINDPNGLCKFGDNYHIFYQYSPLDVNGGLKFWGHITTKDFVHYKQEPIFLYPDKSFDKTGVYSGSAFVKDKEMFLFYTGNVKYEGNYDYILKGREHNTIFVEYDGQNVSDKTVLFTNDDYPEDVTLHVRDPKVFEYKDQYYMVLGARSKENKGLLLVYQSSNLKEWSYFRRIEGNALGYMWECPDMIFQDGKFITIFSPQGLQKEKYQFQNQYQSGYIVKDEKAFFDENETFSLEEFIELDKGFDFYAPQTFQDDKKRTILIAWVGMPDENNHKNPTVEKYWQHQLSLPRQIELKDGRLYQQPIEELKQLRTSQMELTHITLTEDKQQWNIIEQYAFELQLELLSDFFVIEFRDVTLQYKDNVFTLKMGKCGYGRKERRVKIEKLSHLQIFSDQSSLEIFLNDGQECMTTRIYNDTMISTLQMAGSGSCSLKKYNLQAIQYDEK